jgi:hypothetical protein
MTTPILITKSPKSIGISILLTILFGPIGLFYATVSGALIMLLAPVLVLILFLIGLIQDNPVLMNLSLGLLIFFALTYWLISIIWGIISVNSYNKEVEAENRRQFELWERLNEINQKQIIINVNRDSSKINITGQGGAESLKPGFQEWSKSNPGKSINDYFAKFGR